MSFAEMCEVAMLWLNANASAVQALAATATVIATIVLAVITAKYVNLTRSLGEAAHQSLEQQREATRARRRHLQSLVRTLRLILGGLPTDRQQGELLRRVPMWEQENLADLQGLAAEVGAREGEVGFPRSRGRFSYAA